jgi:pimeloyl-ACP methyl ester carboxylesterase
MIKEKKINIGSVALNCVEGPPSGPPLILLHGIPSRWQEFMPLLPVLTLQHHVFALDFRGYGESGRTPGQYQSKYYISDVIHFLEHQIDPPAILYGHSGGGLVALSVAAQLPEFVQGVIAGDSPLDMDALMNWMTSAGFKHHFSELQRIAGLEDHSIPEIAAQIADISVSVPGQEAPIRYGESPGVGAIHMQQLALTLKNMDPDALAYHATGQAEVFLEGFDLEQLLGKITCPILLLQGNLSLGSMLTDEAVDHVKSILPNTECVYLASSGHELGLDSWEVGPLLRAVMSFLDAL